MYTLIKNSFYRISRCALKTQYHLCVKTLTKWRGYYTTGGLMLYACTIEYSVTTNNSHNVAVGTISKTKCFYS